MTTINPIKNPSICIPRVYSSINKNFIKDKFLLGKVVKIVYDFPWFWKCSLYKPSL